MYKNLLKPIFDFLAVLLGLLLLFPVFIAIAILIKLTSKGPVFFMQKRLGKNARTFKVYKFRTMTNKERVVNQEILNDNTEVTKVGYYLRRFKIDELPQLINVLKGDMSLIGPRPCMPIQQNEFNDDAKMRLLVRPGLTGLAQTNGNIYLSWEERWKYDRKYVDNISFVLDFKIFIKTIAIVLFGEDKFVKKPNDV